VKIGFGGSLPKEVCSRSSHSLAPWLALKVVISIGRECSGLGLLRGRLFFAWSTALGKILTLDNLKKRHVIMVDRCCLCKRNGESADHLLLHCDVAFALWSALFTRFGTSWAMPRIVIDLFACWWTRPRSVVIWKMVPICLFWCLWKEINNRYFEDLERSLEDILASFFHPLYLWTVVFVFPLSLSFVDFLVCFSLSS